MDWYYEQMEYAHPVKMDELADMKIKNYESGRPIEVGDIVFYGFLQEQTDNPEEINVKMIKFNKEEINKIYKVMENKGAFDNRFPTLKKIK